MKTFKNLLTIIGGIAVIAGAKTIYEKKKKSWYLKGKLDAIDEIINMTKDMLAGKESEETEEEPTMALLFFRKERFL